MALQTVDRGVNPDGGHAVRLLQQLARLGASPSGRPVPAGRRRMLARDDERARGHVRSTQGPFPVIDPNPNHFSEELSLSELESFFFEFLDHISVFEIMLWTVSFMSESMSSWGSRYDVLTNKIGLSYEEYR